MFENLEKLMEERGLNLHSVAVRAGLSPSTLYSWKTKQRVPTYRVCKKLAKLFDVDVSTFYDPEKAKLDKEEKDTAKKQYKQNFKEIQQAIGNVKITSYEEAKTSDTINNMLVPEPKTVSDIAQNLSVLMAAFKINAAQLARRLEITHSTICCWKKGTFTPRRNGAEMLAEFFKAPVKLFLISDDN
jgi:transcriptional regulator with XRE-family HTH domain